MQIVVLPYYIITYLWWGIRWAVLFWILRRPYGPEEQEFLTRWRLGFSQARWEGLDEGVRTDYLQKELWDYGKYKVGVVLAILYLLLSHQ